MREFASFVFYGYVFISIIQLIGHFNYDEAPTSVSCVKHKARKVHSANDRTYGFTISNILFCNIDFQGFLVAVSGFACYFAVGVKHIQIGIQPSEVEEEQLLPTGCVSIVLSFVYLFDSVLTVMLSLKE